MTQTTRFICQNCGYDSPKWAGQCFGCGEWNTLVETIVAAKKTGARRGLSSSPKPREVQRLSEIKGKDLLRSKTGIGEFDRVLGDGFVPGQVVLLAGEPGIGKSTLLLQVASAVLKTQEAATLYVSGEESLNQIKIRADRMGINSTQIELLSETDADVVASNLNFKKYALVIADSIQTFTTAELTGTAGSVGQVKECAARLAHAAKGTGTPLIIVGHVTKEGAIAGPKVLEHLVDTVLYLEGDKFHAFRILRTTKNRFGDAAEVGVFEMTGRGMLAVDNPSDRFLAERCQGASGSVVTVTLEGSRPVLLEVQALTTKTAFGYPRRTASGFSYNRLLLLLAVLEKHAGLRLQDRDVYVNVAAGVRINEPAADLAVCLAVASSVKDQPLDPKTAVFGEVGLSGEIRSVSQQERRAKEAEKMGFTKIISPEKCKGIAQALSAISQRHEN